MADIEVLLPKMGESVAEATITSWLKNVGDTIEEDEPIVEIATDKVDSEVPSPASGVIKQILFNEGDVVPVGAVFAIIGSAGDAYSPVSTPAQDSIQPVSEVKVEEALLAPISANGNGAGIPKTSDAGKFYSPLVRSIAETEGISLNELEAITGSGQEGRVTKKDILAYLDNRGAAPAVNVQVAKPVEEKVDVKPKTAAASEGVATQVHKAPPVPIGPNDEIIEMDRMRKMIADHMVMSTHVSPHVTSFVEADVTNIVLWREKNKKSFFEKTGEKLTFTPIFIEAVVKALQDFPMVNTMLNGKDIVVKKDINVGMATALPTGNLIVPVIHNADQYNMVGLAKKVNKLADLARTNKLSPDDIQGGTYTVSNVGTFGNVMGTPIINQPQSAILALGAIRKKPAVIETPFGDTIGIRHQMFLSHSYDHRIIDGALGGSFVKRVADYLEAFDLERTI
ncbi:MAG: 2-oxo acid dehydrogenase subunit E2 [Flavobacteriales bacterium]|nr:2-oxo acid dehydrogenase subunit E2 [Flavobacteriales bacterium]MCB9196210.1 2-oxo acid dehydrogenase subunit E2 [Flavobacteriales bacterium]